MGLFALSLLIGGLLAVIDRANPAIRADMLGWRPANPRRFLIALGISVAVVVVGYVIAWLHYYDVAAPSNEFRLLVLLRRTVQYLPLMAAGAAVGFEAIRWLHRVGQPGQPHVIPHGIGVGAAGLTVLALFLLQDPRVLGTIRTVNTPVLSLEFKLAESARPLSAPSGTSPFVSAVGQDPINLALAILGGLPDSIDRDISYAEELTGGQLDLSKKNGLLQEQRFYRTTLTPLITCIAAIRERVSDTNASILMDAEASRALRRVHRILLSDQATRADFLKAITDFANGPLGPLFRGLKQRLEQHRPIEPPFPRLESLKDRPLEDLKVCDGLSADGLTRAIVDHATQGGFSPDSPYFSLVVAGMLNIMDEKLAAIDELDAWLNHHRKPHATATKDYPRAPATQLGRMMRMRAHFVAAQWTANDQRQAGAVVRRLRRAIDLIDEAFAHATLEGAKNGLSLRALLDEMDRRQDSARAPDALCRKLPTNVGRLTFATLGMINSAVYLAQHFDLMLLEFDHGEFVRDHLEILGLAEPSCFDDRHFPPHVRDFSLAAFSNTYLITKFVLLRTLPQDRVRAELCTIAKVADEAQRHMLRVMHHGQARLDVLDDRKAEDRFELARTLKRQIILYNETVNRLGGRAC
jgi:hypothetical protein